MLTYQDNNLFIEDVSASFIAKTYGTPTYIYSAKQIHDNFQQYALNMPPNGLVCYAVKANSNIAILQLLAKLGAGFDIVSGGELARVIKAGANPNKVVFSGVGKTIEEMQYALNAGIYCFNLESISEAFTLQQVAKSLNKIAPISLRINPNIDACSHPYIATGLQTSKFGIEIKQAYDLYIQLAESPHLKIVGIDCHIGSQITQTAPFLEALECTLELITKLKSAGVHLNHLDLGGGLGVRYIDENPPTISSYLTDIKNYLHKNSAHNLRLILEPGRSIVANAGILLTKVLYLKNNAVKNFAILDGAMNDLIRPALYQAQMPIIPVKRTSDHPTSYDLVGPVCETGDFLAQNCLLNISPNDLLAIGGAGAYGFSMSSNYNSRPRVAEVLIDGKNHHLIRKRESVEDLFAHEQLI